MKVLERVVEGLVRQRVEIDEMQCGFMSATGEALGCQQAALDGLCRPGESI